MKNTDFYAAGYDSIPHDVQDICEPLEYMIYSVLLRYARMGNGAFPNRQTIADKVKRKVWIVSKTLNALEEKNLIRREMRKGKSTFYRLFNTQGAEFQPCKPCDVPHDYPRHPCDVPHDHPCDVPHDHPCDVPHTNNKEENKKELMKMVPPTPADSSNADYPDLTAEEVKELNTAAENMWKIYPEERRQNYLATIRDMKNAIYEECRKSREKGETKPLKRAIVLVYNATVGYLNRVRRWTNKEKTERLISSTKFYSLKRYLDNPATWRGEKEESEFAQTRADGTRIGVL